MTALKKEPQIWHDCIELSNKVDTSKPVKSNGLGGSPLQTIGTSDRPRDAPQAGFQPFGPVLQRGHGRLQDSSQTCKRCDLTMESCCQAEVYQMCFSVVEGPVRARA